MSRIPPSSIRLTCATQDSPFVGTSQYFFETQAKQNLALIQTAKPLGRVLRWPLGPTKRGALCVLQPGVLPIYAQLRTQRYVCLMLSQSHSWFNTKILSCGQHAHVSLDVVQKFNPMFSLTFGLLPLPFAFAKAKEKQRQDKSSKVANPNGGSFETSLQHDAIKQLNVAKPKKGASKRIPKPVMENLWKPQTQLKRRTAKAAGGWHISSVVTYSMSRLALGYDNNWPWNNWPLFNIHDYGLGVKLSLKQLQSQGKLQKPLQSLLSLQRLRLAWKRKKSYLSSKPNRAASYVSFLRQYGAKATKATCLFMLLCMQQLTGKVYDPKSNTLVANITASEIGSSSKFKKQSHYYDFQYLEQIEPYQNFQLYGSKHLPKAAVNVRVLDPWSKQRGSKGALSVKPRLRSRRVNTGLSVSQYTNSVLTNVSPKIAIDRSFNAKVGLNLFSFILGQFAPCAKQHLWPQDNFQLGNVNKAPRLKLKHTKVKMHKSCDRQIKNPVFMPCSQCTPWYRKAGSGRLKTCVIFDLKLHSQPLLKGSEAKKSLRPTLSIRL
jgi:hypothetical protein